VVADQIRMLYHAFRGESEEVQRYRERVELFAVQGSTTWQVEMFWPAILVAADVLTGDAIAARRTAEQLARRAKDVPVLQKYADTAHAGYLLLRGEINHAIAAYEKVLPEFPLRQSVAYERVRSHFAQALNLAGHHARAKAVVLEAISGMVDADGGLFHFLEAYRQLALAEAGLGNQAEALAILDRLLAEHGHKGNRLMIGLLHKARAEVALNTKDADAFELHVREMEQRFRSTRNPALIAQCERLLDRAARLGVRKLEPLGVQDAETVQGLSAMISGTVGELSGTVDPCAHALQVILTRANAKSGFLYLRRQGAMILAAASDPNPPPRSLEDALKELADKAPPSPAHTEQWSSAYPASGLQTAPVISTTGGQSTTGSSGHSEDSDLGQTALAGTGDSLPAPDEENDGEIGETQAISDGARTGNTVFLRSVPPPGPWGAYQLVLLDARQGESRVVIGGLILEAKPQTVARLSKELLKGIAQVLHDRQITTAFSSLEA
jgi:tetratricopeptide (TPR) repeat protein